MNSFSQFGRAVCDFTQVVEATRARSAAVAATRSGLVRCPGAVENSITASATSQSRTRQIQSCPSIALRID